jgi:short-subunit dehydrogenase
MRILDKYKGLNVLITGATSGIGYEFVKIFAIAGFTLILVSRNKDKLEFVKKEFNDKAREIHIIQADLSRSGAAQNVFAQVENLGVNVDVLVNNAGKGLSGENIGLQSEQISELIGLNVTTPTELCILFGRKMAERNKGYILNVGSLIGYFSLPLFSPYAASKSYILNYSRSLRTELKSRKVSVTCLIPGFTRTNFDSNAQIESDSYKKFSKAIAMDPSKVACSGIRAMFAGKAAHIPGIENKLSFLFSRIIPPGVISLVAYKFMSQFIQEKV